MSHRPLTSRAVVAAVAILSVYGCAPKTAPAPVPAPAPPPAVVAPTPVGPTVATTCPSPTDGPSIVVSAVEESYRAFRANPTGAIPPACVLTAFAKLNTSLPDSMVGHAVSLAEEATRREPKAMERLTTETVLLARAARHGDALRAYNRVVAEDSARVTPELHRIGIRAAHRVADTASLLRALTRASRDPGASPSFNMEQRIITSVRALLTAIESGRGLLRQNPNYVAAFPSLIINFGQLGNSDSVMAYARRALAARAEPTSITGAMDAIVATMLRHATLYGPVESWETLVRKGMRVDSTLSTPSTKLLVSALITYAADAQVAEIAALVGGKVVGPMVGDAESRARAAADRDVGCRRIPSLKALLDVAEARLRDGGSRYPGPTVPAIVTGLSQARNSIVDLQLQCG
jgi:hypothetical protein